MDDRNASGALNDRRVIVLAKSDIEEANLPADWAFSRVLRTHLS